MQPEHEEIAALFDMLEFAREITTFIKDRRRRDLDTDRVLLRALERGFELIGECARRISEPTRRANPDVPWRAIVGMRNIIAHEYGQVDANQLWITAAVEAPKLVKELERIANKLPAPQ